MSGMTDDSSRTTGDRGRRDDWRRNERLLRERWNELRAAMRDARQAGTEAWPEIRTDLESALGDLRHALDLATQRFRAVRARSVAARKAAAATTTANAATPPDLRLPALEREADEDTQC